MRMKRSSSSVLSFGDVFLYKCCGVRHSSIASSLGILVPFRLCPSFCQSLSPLGNRRLFELDRFLPLVRTEPLVRSYHGRRGMSKNGSKELGETSTMRQEGLEIQEVPLAVIKSTDTEHPSSSKLPSGKAYLQLDPKEESAFVEGFNALNSPQEILKILDTIPTQEVTPVVCLGILQKLFELENNFGFRNNGLSWTVSSENPFVDTFARTAIVTHLLETIATSSQVEDLLKGLSILVKERPVDSGDEYRNCLYDQVLLRVTKGEFSVPQVCKAMISLGHIEAVTHRAINNDLIDKLWVGIFDKSEEIDAENVKLLFKVLPYLKKSQRLVLNLAEQKILLLWWRMNIDAVSSICEILMIQKPLSVFKANESVETRERIAVSSRVLSALSRCCNLNVHHMKETDVLTIIKAFYVQNFCDSAFEKALNKYMKAKCLKISDPRVVTTVCEYVTKFHIRSETILEAVAAFVVLHKGKNMSPTDLTGIVSAFGRLDFQPPDGVRFWKIIEQCITDKFMQFSPKDVLDVLLSCVYLTKFPLNFVDYVFSPYFLDRVHMSEQDYKLQIVRSKLKLLDTALLIECPNKYNGPLLPKDFTARSVFIDGRILRMGNWLEEIVKEVVGVSNTVERFVILPGLPLHSLYIADILIFPEKRKSEGERHVYLKNYIASKLMTGNSVVPAPSFKNLTILLIHLPEHFSRDGKHLIGSEIMRIRHLKLLGFTVVPFNYTQLHTLKLQPSAIREHIRERLRNPSDVYMQ